MHFLKVFLEVLELFRSFAGRASLENQYNRMSFSKSQENRFFIPCKITKCPPPHPEGQNLIINFNFRGHLSTFRAEYTVKSWAFKAKNNAQTTSA